MQASDLAKAKPEVSKATAKKALEKQKALAKAKMLAKAKILAMARMAKVAKVAILLAPNLASLLVAITVSYTHLRAHET